MHQSGYEFGNRTHIYPEHSRLGVRHLEALDSQNDRLIPSPATPHLQCSLTHPDANRFEGSGQDAVWKSIWTVLVGKDPKRIGGDLQSESAILSVPSPGCVAIEQTGNRLQALASSHQHRKSLFEGQEIHRQSE